MDDNSEGSEGSWGSEGSELGRMLRSAEVSIPGEGTDSPYLLKLFLHRHREGYGAKEIRADLFAPGTAGKPEDLVGNLKGTLLRRPDPHFFEVADASQELMDLAATFCNSNGVANRIKHPRLIESPSAVNGGGFLQIYSFEVRLDHQKKDLGLRMVHETLVFLRGEWTMAVMVPEPLGRHCRKWPPSHLPEDPHGDITPEKKAAIAAKDLKVCQLVSRMGFVQAGRTRALEGFFFLTSDRYLPVGSDPAEAINQWIGKEEAGGIDIFVPADMPTPSGLDEELKHTLLRSKTIPGMDLIQSVADLIGRGASISGAGAMHVAAANPDLGPPILRELIRLGGDVDNPDASGNTPLHVAATIKAVSSIKYLLECGANRTRQNEEGDTPLMCCERASQSSKDFLTAMALNLPPRDIDIMPEYEAMTLLMDQILRTHLIEGWLSPRMREMLKITAESEADQLLNEGDLYAVELFIPTEIREQGLPECFTTGLGMVFETVARLLRAGRVPTVDSIKRSVSQSIHGGHNFTRMLEAGGKVEFALDALFNITEQVLVKGDCGWEYETFEDAIEAHPSTPLDGSFDIAFFMCINKGGGTLESRGPTGRRSFY
jgi:hypothetical protein